MDNCRTVTVPPCHAVVWQVLDVTLSHCRTYVWQQLAHPAELCFELVLCPASLHVHACCQGCIVMVATHHPTTGVLTPSPHSSNHLETEIAVHCTSLGGTRYTSSGQDMQCGSKRVESTYSAVCVAVNAVQWCHVCTQAVPTCCTYVESKLIDTKTHRFQETPPTCALPARCCYVQCGLTLEQTKHPPPVTLALCPPDHPQGSSCRHGGCTGPFQGGSAMHHSSHAHPQPVARHTIRQTMFEPNHVAAAAAASICQHTRYLLVVAEASAAVWPTAVRCIGAVHVDWEAVGKSTDQNTTTRVVPVPCSCNRCTFALLHMPGCDFAKQMVHRACEIRHPQ